MRNSDLIKILKAVTLLSQKNGTTLNELAAELGIHIRTVHRKIKTIENQLGFPVYEEISPQGRHKIYKLEQSYVKKLPQISVPDINLSLSEIIALYMLKGEGTVFKGTEIGRKINSCFKKLALFLPDTTASRLEKISTLSLTTQKFFKVYTDKEDIISTLTDAILDSKTCYVKYHSFYDDQEKSFAIDPLHFFENNGGLYLIVKTTTFKDIRTLAIERIMEITKSEKSFEYPDDFNPDDLLSSAFNICFDDPVNVKIWFSADQARYIKERNWAKDQHIDEQKDGSLILSMKTSGWWDVKRWVISYGSDAMVLEPEEMKNEIITELKSLVELYQKDCLF